MADTPAEQAKRVIELLKNYRGMRLLHDDIEEMEAEILIALTKLLAKP